MTDITPARKNIQIEESIFRYAVAESFAQKAGGSINFINEYQHSEKQFFINGRVSGLTAPFDAVDGYAFAQRDAEIFDVWMFLQPATTGYSGTLELDIKYATAPGESWTSIFSTTPKIQAAALTAFPNGVWIHVGSAISNTTAPVITGTTITIPGGSAMRLDIIQNMDGLSETGTGLVAHYRPV